MTGRTKSEVIKLGFLTTHVLDTSRGQPASNLELELWRIKPTKTRLLKTRTNNNGRVDTKLLEGDEFKVGQYELIFHASEYLSANGVLLPDTPFLEDIIIRFGISDPDQHYHVPLLLSPYGYSTYRGS